MNQTGLPNTLSSTQPRTAGIHPSVELNQETRMHNDVQSIVHIPNESKIIVHLNHNRTCLQPQLIGRLSGAFLSKVTWHYEEGIASDDVIVGYYNVPSPGRYFIEIIVSICQKLDMDTDVKGICLVDPVEHRITAYNATIDAAAIASNEMQGIGFWYNKNQIVEPMITRYQPQECRGTNSTLDRCKSPMDVTRYDPYEFIFNTEFHIQQHLKNKMERLCFLGASHSRVLSRFATKLQSNLHVIHLDYRFVANLTQSIVSHVSKCDHVIIGMGQWDASLKSGGEGPTPFNEFMRQLNNAMVEFVKPVMGVNTSVYFRNMQ